MEFIPGDKDKKTVTPVALEKVFRLLQKMPGGLKFVVVAGAVGIIMVPDVWPFAQDAMDLLLAITAFLVAVAPKKED